MKLIYTNENRFLVNNIKNILATAGIEIALRNEYAVGGAGDLSPFDTWLELWIANDTDYEKARQMIQDATLSCDAEEWICGNCSETNDASFELCWYCQHDKQVTGSDTTK